MKSYIVLVGMLIVVGFVFFNHRQEKKTMMYYDSSYQCPSWKKVIYDTVTKKLTCEE